MWNMRRDVNLVISLCLTLLYRESLREERRALSDAIREADRA